MVGLLQRRVWMSAALFALTAALFASEVAAQAPKAAPPAGAPPAGAAGGMPDNLIDLILAGGWLNVVFMIVIGMFSLWSFAIVFERLVMTRRSRMAPRPLVAGMEELVSRVEGNPQLFRNLCEKYPSPLANVVSAAMSRAGRPWPEVEKALEDGVSGEVSYLRQKIAGLAVSAAVSTLLGLWGTVIGMIQAFQQASQVGTGKAEALAKGIYLALETTVAGLGVAIPAILMQGWMRGRNFKIGAGWNAIVGTLMPCFHRMERWEQRKNKGETGASAIMDRPAGMSSSPSQSASLDAIPEQAISNAEMPVQKTGESAEITLDSTAEEIEEAESVDPKKPKIPTRPGGGIRGR